MNVSEDLCCCNMSKAHKPVEELGHALVGELESRYEEVEWLLELHYGAAGIALVFVRQA